MHDLLPFLQGTIALKSRRIACGCILCEFDEHKHFHKAVQMDEHSISFALDPSINFDLHLTPTDYLIFHSHSGI